MGNNNSLMDVGSNEPVGRSQLKTKQIAERHMHETIPPTKTHFYYINPLTLENDDFPLDQDEDVELDPVTEKQIQDQIQGEMEQEAYMKGYNPAHTQSIVFLEEIKVKWNSFIKMKNTNFLKDYAIKKEIGRGGFGCVYKVKSIYTGIYRAAKKIKKSDMPAIQHEKLFEQMAIMKGLDHPNIAKLYEVYDYKDNYVLIMELCEGGQLFKKIITKKITPAIAAFVSKQVFGALIYLHNLSIIHRDLKPQNMLFEKGTNNIKIIDFGIAVKKKSSCEILTQRLGTAYYIAPEVLLKNYTQKCDVWAMGVILYMMLFCKPPFSGEDQNQIMDKILKEEVQFKGKEWINLDKHCKAFLVGLLKKKPSERCTAKQAYESEWLQNCQKQVVTVENMNLTLEKMRKFGFRNKLEAVVYTYIISQLITSEEKQALINIFTEIDLNKDGKISKQQFKNVIFERLKFKEDKLSTLMRMIDLDGSGDIQFTQFLVAAINPREYLRIDHYEKAFQYFDIDHSGEITYEEICQFLDQSKESSESIKKIFNEVDLDGNGTISKQEFVSLFINKYQKEVKDNQSLFSTQINVEEEEIKHKEKENKPEKRKNSQFNKNNKIQLEEKEKKKQSSLKIISIQETPKKQMKVVISNETQILKKRDSNFKELKESATKKEEGRKKAIKGQ